VTGRRKPTRRDLLIVIGRLEGAVSELANMFHPHANNTADRADVIARRALDIAFAARSFDPPVDGRLGPWGEEDAG